MIDQRILVKSLLKSANNSKKLHQVMNALGGFEFLDPSDSQPAAILFYELSDAPNKDLDIIESLLKSGAAAEVFLTGDLIDSSLLVQAMRLGIKEFIPQPLSETEVQQSLKRFKERHDSAVARSIRKRGRIISVFGSKGGVGTTTVAVNLAVALNKVIESKSVALVDMNTLFGEIPLFLEIAPKFHWGEITRNIERLDETFLSNVLTRHRSGIHVLPSPAYLNGHVRPTPEIMSKLMALMVSMFDFIIIDAGQSTNDTALKVLQLSEHLLLITILSLPCLANANKMIKSLTELGYVPNERINVVLNRYIKKGEISIADAEAGLGKRLFSTIPNDFTATMSAINHGKPLLDVAPKAEISKSFLELAGMLSQPGEAQDENEKDVLL